MGALKTFLPLSTILLSVDMCWAIEPTWGIRALSILDGIDYGAHLVEYAARRLRSAPRADRGPQITLGEDGDGDDTVDDDDSRRDYGGFAPDRAEKEKRYHLRDRVATIHLCGPMTKRPQSWGDGCATVLVRRALRQAVADPEVGAILLLIDSPGGQVAGTHDLAMDVAEASRRKPLATYAEDLCCSAAYWSGSQAGAGFWCNATATVGSVGTIMVLEDCSAAARKEGVKVHVIATGDRKGIGARGVEISDAQIEYLHAYLDQVNAQFLRAVMAARKLTAGQQADVFRAGIYVGEAACAIGLCDGVKTRDEVHAMLAGKAAPAAAVQPLQDGQRASQGAAPTSAWTPLRDEDAPVVRVLPNIGDRPAPASARRLAAAAASDVPEGTTRPATVPLSQGSEKPAHAGTGEGKKMQVSFKELIVRSLKAFGLHTMALAVVTSNDEAPESLAAAMAEQVEAEVQNRLAKDPMRQACSAAGLNEPSDIVHVKGLAALGLEYIEESRAEAKGHAVRAFGPEAGYTIGQQVNYMDIRQIRTMSAAWSKQADAKYDIPADGQPAQRSSAPKAVAEAVPASGTDAQPAKSAWEQLTADQRAFGLKMGMNTEAKQESFAKEALAAQGMA